MRKIEKEVINEILKWSRWKKQEKDYWEKSGKYITKEIKLWQKKLKKKIKK